MLCGINNVLNPTVTVQMNWETPVCLNLLAHRSSWLPTKATIPVFAGLSALQSTWLHMLSAPSLWARYVYENVINDKNQQLKRECHRTATETWASSFDSLCRNDMRSENKRSADEFLPRGGWIVMSVGKPVVVSKATVAMCCSVHAHVGLQKHRASYS